jgi:hypothetical protein
MKERPILFSGAMVRAILSGAKTQTRRIVKPQPECCDIRDSPYHKGMRLWVREAWNFLGTDMMRHGRTHSTQDGVVKYLADGERRTINTKWRNVEVWMARKPQSRPSIHMPRWASRITLEITSVRVERLQAISEADAAAEGCDGNCPIGHLPAYMKGPLSYHYAQLWESINGPGSWEANPWVWVVEFRRIGQCAREVCNAIPREHLPQVGTELIARPTRKYGE